jgi:hypothetical protein
MKRLIFGIPPRVIMGVLDKEDDVLESVEYLASVNKLMEKQA